MVAMFRIWGDAVAPAAWATAGSFSRSFDTQGIDTDAISASFTDGVLTLTLPKIIETRPASRKLEIQ